MSEKFDYHIQETNRRLGQIEVKMDMLIETRLRVEEVSKRVSVWYSMIVSIVTSVSAALLLAYLRSKH
jgi:hypothetical protein